MDTYLLIEVVDQLHEAVQRIIKPVADDALQHDVIRRRAANLVRRVDLLSDQINDDPNIDMLQIAFAEVNLELDRIIQAIREGRYA